MNIDIETHGIDLDRDLNHFTMCCAAFELGPQRSRVESVQIQLSHVAEPRHRYDRYCLVKVNLSDGSSVHTRDADSDLHVAIYRALERAGRKSAQSGLRGHPRPGTAPVPRPLAPDHGEPNWAA